MCGSGLACDIPMSDNAWFCDNHGYVSTAMPQVSGTFVLVILGHPERARRHEINEYVALQAKDTPNTHTHLADQPWRCAKSWAQACLPDVTTLLVKDEVGEERPWLVAKSARKMLMVLPVPNSGSSCTMARAPMVVLLASNNKRNPAPHIRI